MHLRGFWEYHKMEQLETRLETSGGRGKAHKWIRLKWSDTLSIHPGFAPQKKKSVISNITKGTKRSPMLVTTQPDVFLLSPGKALVFGSQMVSMCDL